MEKVDRSINENSEVRVGSSHENIKRTYDRAISHESPITSKKVERKLSVEVFVLIRFSP